MIEARGLSKIFNDKKRGEVRAVDSVSFRCEPGQIYGLLGANGAGKTTTLRMLATILAPTAGAATVAGFDVVREPAKVRAHIGFLSTATALYDRLTAAGNGGIFRAALRARFRHHRSANRRNLQDPGHGRISRPPLR